MTASATAATGAATDYDVIIVGAGMSGLYLIHRLRELGFTVRCYEAGDGVGGTWYWNRYPGCRFDSESWAYGYSWSQELLEEWNWSEHFAAQPETERYLNHVADKFDLRRDIQLSTRVAGARYDAATNTWTVETAHGEQATARYFVTAVGVLSAPYTPDIPGRDDFQGLALHTAEWPKEPIDFSARRIAVIGSGATAVQLITEVGKNVGHMTVFQRTPNYCLPLGNSPIGDEEMARIKQDYPEIFRKCRESFGAFPYNFDPRSAFDVSDEERRRIYEEMYAEPGFRIWLGNFFDILTDRRANDTMAEFVREKIRGRVDDPETARKLTPTDYPFGTKRVPLESGYFETFNRANVELVDLNEEPIERITANGVKTSSREYAVDTIVYATGFDAVTGALVRMDIRGEDGQALADKWADGPRTYLGLTTAGFPNMFIVVGPQNAASFCNVPRCIEQNVEWVTDCIAWLRDRGVARIAARPESEQAWVEHCEALINATLLPETDSWFMGANIPGKKRVFLNYAGGAMEYRQQCDDAAQAGYAGFALT
ncbi:MAG: NAD(P)/FAD-dependent oxidoreductase [Gammaproteobacteria bacterium]|nr:NAD(P)/FAD-dependent oxidoreductase [Gammaproteobacteria bacterium]